jgi:hypothetical protein
MKSVGPGRYTRGWETLGHYLSMFRSSLRLHLFLSLFLALIFGSIWFSFMLPEGEGASFWGLPKSFFGFGAIRFERWS